MMRQYRQAKAELPADTLLLFRMGDFYEMFFDDAAKGSRLMDIALTQRAGIAMAGIPYHALQSYLPQLLERGISVAIAEQMEDPKTAKGLVKREITQVITPGTILDGGALASTKSNFLVCVAAAKDDRYGIAMLDISTGDFRLTEVVSMERLATELHRLQPAECPISAALQKRWDTAGYPDLTRTPIWTVVEDWTFDTEIVTDLLQRHFAVQTLDGFGCREYPLGVCAAGAVLHYAQTNLRRNAHHITRVSPYSIADYMVIDRVTQRNLELIEPLLPDARKSTLLSVLDATITPMGGRLLREWIVRPLVDARQILARMDAVTALVGNQLMLLELREILHQVRDIERTVSRLNVGAANARDLQVLLRGATAIPGLKSVLALAGTAEQLTALREQLHEQPEMIERIDRAIVDEPPLTVKEGGMIREGYHAHLDELRKASRDGKQWITDLQRREQERSGIKSLKIRYNKVFGYYIEVSKKNEDLVPVDYVRKQTLVNAERFVTTELKEIEDKIIGAEDKAKALEYEIFQEVRTYVIAQTSAIQESARAIAELDAIASLAEVALKNNYRRPQITDDLTIKIENGRHPVIESIAETDPFVPNDTFLNGASDQMLVITGPNMAGKSTYIRQVALIVLMAQMGSYVPASSATIGLVDRIFTRIGAADDLTRGHSTFMVEMVETANILNNATPRSLIILDEVGRGTSTFDGLSIAWAIAEYIHNHPQLRSRTLFATHYHELTELALTMPGVKNYNVIVKEVGETIKFLRKIMPGAADRSYGIQVARLAGLPKGVLDRAAELLVNLEGDAVDEVSHQPKLARKRKQKDDKSQQPSLFDWS